MRDPAGEAIDEVSGSPPEATMWLKSITTLTLVPGEPVGEWLCAFDIAAEPVEVKGFGPDLDAVAACLLGGARQFLRRPGRGRRRVIERLVIDRAAGQHQRMRTGGRRLG